ncbi:hypothetical protein B0T17DRAFT_510021 [Bombardia bombarda]|uniref:Uncharacterized protein n=1 Tax=Bombardia bombarda TaxID=252184 RepID=A0AA39WN53_9PEZI|nr:hypothetical protein B0T17DRAFT_510021 [Bombardia bombarda]
MSTPRQAGPGLCLCGLFGLGLGRPWTCGLCGQVWALGCEPVSCGLREATWCGGPKNAGGIFWRALLQVGTSPASAPWKCRLPYPSPATLGTFEDGGRILAGGNGTALWRGPVGVPSTIPSSGLFLLEVTVLGSLLAVPRPAQIGYLS